MLLIAYTQYSSFFTNVNFRRALVQSETVPSVIVLIGRCVFLKKKNILFKVEQNCKYNTSEFAITSTSHTICTTKYIWVSALDRDYWPPVPMWSWRPQLSPRQAVICQSSSLLRHFPPQTSRSFRLWTPPQKALQCEITGLWRYVTATCMYTCTLAHMCTHIQ